MAAASEVHIDRMTGIKKSLNGLFRIEKTGTMLKSNNKTKFMAKAKKSS